MTEQLDGQIGWFGQDIWCGKTYQEPSAATGARTSKPSLKKSSGSSKNKSPICLMLSKGDGQKPGASTTNWAPGVLLGAYTTHSFGDAPNMLMDECSIGEPRNGVSVSRLSQILEDYQHQTSYSSEKDFMEHMKRYELSPKACKGILNRAERRGKKLPDELMKALTSQAAL